MKEKNFYLEYSPTQEAFHITTIDRIIDSNVKLISRNINNGYLVIGGPGNNEQMKQCRKIFEETILKKEENHNKN